MNKAVMFFMQFPFQRKKIGFLNPGRLEKKDLCMHPFAGAHIFLKSISSSKVPRSDLNCECSPIGSFYPLGPVSTSSPA